MQLFLVNAAVRNVHIHMLPSNPPSGSSLLGGGWDEEEELNKIELCILATH